VEDVSCNVKIIDIHAVKFSRHADSVNHRNLKWAEMGISVNSRWHEAYAAALLRIRICWLRRSVAASVLHDVSEEGSDFVLRVEGSNKTYVLTAVYGYILAAICNVLNSYSLFSFLFFRSLFFSGTIAVKCCVVIWIVVAEGSVGVRH